MVSRWFKEIACLLVRLRKAVNEPKPNQERVRRLVSLIERKAENTAPTWFGMLRNKDWKRLQVILKEEKKYP